MPIGQQSIVDLDKKTEATETAAGKKPRSTAKKNPPGPSDADLKTRLGGVFDRLAESASVRGDDELAEVIREDGPTMVNALVSMTRPFKALRAPLVLLLGVAEPVIAFQRVARIVISRVMFRRTEKPVEGENVNP